MYLFVYRKRTFSPQNELVLSFSYHYWKSVTNGSCCKCLQRGIFLQGFGTVQFLKDHPFQFKQWIAKVFRPRCGKKAVSAQDDLLIHLPHSLRWANKIAWEDKLWTTPRHAPVLPQAAEKAQRDNAFGFPIHQLRKDFNPFLHWKELQDRQTCAIHKIAQNILTFCPQGVHW